MTKDIAVLNQPKTSKWKDLQERQYAQDREFEDPEKFPLQKKMTSTYSFPVMKGRVFE